MTHRFALTIWRPITVAVFLTTGMSAAQTALSADLAEVTALYQSGRYDECVELAGEAIKQRSYSENWRLLKLRAELAVGRYTEAMATFEEALNRFPSSVRLRWWGHQICLFNGQRERAETLLGEVDGLVEKAAWRYRNSSSRVALGRYYLRQGMDPRQVLEATFNRVKKEDPHYVDAYLAAAELALDKHDYQLASEELANAEKIDPSDPDIFLGLARAFAPSDTEKAQKYIETALELNPNHIDSLLFLADAHIDAERYEAAEVALQMVLGVNPLEPRAWAYLAVLAHLDNRPTDEAICRLTGLDWRSEYPEVEHLIGRKLSQKYRFAEGAAYQRQALQRAPGYLPAKIQLSQDLLRLGEDREGWEKAAEAYDQDAYNIVAHNLVTLEENISAYRLLESEGFLVRMEAREAEIYGERVLELLGRARERLCTKYDITLEGTIKIEIFPRQEDFAIRTFGLPGGDGFLGVCFGSVITANSPASQGENPSNWQSVLWHEFCHVVTLHKTRNRMPRWLSEGISVYEETQADSTWGQSMTPEYRDMILNGQLTPVSLLSGAFLRPPSPQHLQFAYFESAMVVEYLVDRHGMDTLKSILVDLGDGISINDALSRHTGSLDALDREFAQHAKQRASELAPDADWQTPPLPPTASSKAWAVWNRENPANFRGLQTYAVKLLAERNWQAAKQPLKQMVALYPDDVGAANAYSLLARVHRELEESSEERRVLTQLADRSDDAVDAYVRLMELNAAEEDWDAVSRYAERVLAVNPLLASSHRRLAVVAQRTGDASLAIKSLRALLALDPLDVADIHYRLARNLMEVGDSAGARIHILQSLEEAPRFRDAHRLLLQIVDPNEETSPAVDEVSASPDTEAAATSP